MFQTNSSFTVPADHAPILGIPHIQYSPESVASFEKINFGYCLAHIVNII